VDGHARANRQKPSGIAAKETILNIHLVAWLGTKRLDAITTEEVQQLKHRLSDRAPKTVNNVLTVLNMLLKKAVEWDVIERMPCAVKLLPVPKPSMGFYDFEEYEQLVTSERCSNRTPRIPDRAARRRGRAAMRGNDGVGVARRGSRQTTDLRTAIGVEGPRDGTEGRSPSLRAAHHASRDRSPRTSASPVDPRVVSE
jgi:hypothetical protein